PVESEEAAELALAFPAKTKVVTATRTPHLILDSPFSLSSVSRVELEALGALNVPDGLRLVPGVFVMEAGAGDWNLSIRGLARPLDERFLLLVDNRYAGSEAFAVTFWPLSGPPVALIDHVEVLRGAGSPVHGQNALSGVVQVITRTPDGMLGSADR